MDIRKFWIGWVLKEPSGDRVCRGDFIRNNERAGCHLRLLGQNKENSAPYVVNITYSINRNPHESRGLLLWLLAFKHEIVFQQLNAARDLWQWHGK